MTDAVFADSTTYEIVRTTVTLNSPQPTTLYCTLDDADVYLTTVLNTEVWDLSTDVLRTKALAQATRIIRALNIPDFDTFSKVPADIKAATVEIALKLLDGFDPETELHNATIKSFAFDKLYQSNKDQETPLHIIAGVPSIVAFNILRRYMPDITTVRLCRTD